MAFALVVTGVSVLSLRPEGWFVLHRAVSSLGVGLAVVGLLVAIMMVAEDHFRVLHSLIGALTIIVLFSVPLLGMVRKRTSSPKTRAVHLWTGRATVILLLITILLGLKEAGII